MTEQMNTSGVAIRYSIDFVTMLRMWRQILQPATITWLGFTLLMAGTLRGVVQWRPLAAMLFLGAVIVVVLYLNWRGHVRGKEQLCQLGDEGLTFTDSSMTVLLKWDSLRGFREQPGRFEINYRRSVLLIPTTALDPETRKVALRILRERIIPKPAPSILARRLALVVMIVVVFFAFYFAARPSARVPREPAGTPAQR